METSLLGFRASNSQRNGNGTDEKSSKQCATERERSDREFEHETLNGTVTGRSGKNGRETSKEVGENCASRPQHQTHQKTSRNSRTNLSQNLRRRKEATARQAITIHYGNLHNRY